MFLPKRVSIYINIKATKGNFAFLLKKSSKLTRKYKPRKKHPLEFAKLSSKEEEKKKNDDDRMD